MTARAGRPRGSFGPVARAMLEAAREGPADVRTLAARACIGFAVARYSATRLVAAGCLVADRSRRPYILRIVDGAAPEERPVEFAFAQLSAWMRRP